jgi:NodT family efflux transporter outer membrane factor (OMF) lipoprotein
MVVLLLAGTLSGCAVGPRYRPPTPELPDRWHQAAAEGLAAGNASVETWWQVFEDETLSSLIKRAAEGNLDLRMAVLRIREARALRGVAAGELLPSLGGSGSYQRSKSSANSAMAGPAQGPGKGAQFADSVARGIAGSALGQGLSSAAPNMPGVTNSIASGLIGLIPGRTGLPETDEMDLHAVGFDASWEIYVFGGIQRAIEAADAYVAATMEDCRSVLISLLAEVATTYIDIRTLQNQIQATRQNIALQQEALSLARSRFDLGLAPELNVHQAEVNLATTQSHLPLLEAGLSIAIYRMGVLVGLDPSALYDQLSVEGPIPQPPLETLVGVPADLLRRRPDIRAAERRLAVEVAKIGVATAELYPRFTLSGTFGFEATNFNHLLDARSISYGFGPAVRWNIFDGLRNLNRIAAQEAVSHQAYVLYERSLLLALQEVESSMVSYQREQARRDALSRAVEAARRSVHLAEELYRDGLTDFQNVLDAERSLVNLENALAESRGQVAVKLVALYKALGGGWSAETVPQAEYLEQRTGALADPAGFFLSGGKEPLPWVSHPDEETEKLAAPTEDK